MVISSESLSFDLDEDLPTYTRRRHQMLLDALRRVEEAPLVGDKHQLLGHFLLAGDGATLSLQFPIYDQILDLAAFAIQGIDVLLPAGSIPRGQLTLLHVAVNFPDVTLSELEHVGIHLPLSVPKEALLQLRKKADALSPMRRINLLLNAPNGALRKLREGTSSGTSLAAVAACWALYGIEAETDFSRLDYARGREIQERLDLLPVTDFGLRVTEDLERFFDMVNYMAEHTLRSAPQKAAAYLAAADGILKMSKVSAITRSVPQGLALRAVYEAWQALTKTAKSPSEKTDEQK